MPSADPADFVDAVGDRREALAVKVEPAFVAEARGHGVSGLAARKRGTGMRPASISLRITMSRRGLAEAAQ